MTDPCRYEKEIEDTHGMVRAIYEHLVGTLDKPGLVGRVTKLEEAHASVKRILWAIGVTLATSLTGAFVVWLLGVRA